MSAYAHQMEREFSAQSLSSRGGSELESRYAVESGFYMTSFAATIFIGALVTVGVLFVTLLIALSAMLQSCENRSKGVIEVQNLSDDSSYCRAFALHAELNNLGPDHFHSVCGSLAIQHSTEGQYERDLNISLLVVERYFNTVVPSKDGPDVILVDIDDIFLLSSHYTYLLMHRLYTKLQARGWSLILLSRKEEKQRNATVELLISVGYRGWSSVIMRMDNEMEIASREYFSRRRVAMQKEGFRISGIISSQMDALTGPCFGERIFKLPNPLYYQFEPHRDSVYTSV